MSIWRCEGCGALLADAFKERIEGAERCYFCGDPCRPVEPVEGMANPAAWQTHLDGYLTPPRAGDHRTWKTEMVEIAAERAAIRTGGEEGEGMAAWYLVGGTNPDPPRVIAGPFSTREDAEMAECLYRYAVDHPRDAYEAGSRVVSDAARAGLHSDTGTGWFQHRYRGPEDAAATTDDGGVREREREAVAIVRAIAAMTDEDLLYIPEGYSEWRWAIGWTTTIRTATDGTGGTRTGASRSRATRSR